MTVPEEMMTRIGRGIELNQSGDADGARRHLAEIWDEIGGENGDPFYQCALAHSMADTQHNVHDELEWDLRAVQAANQVTDERAAQAGVTSPVAGFYPSLHLNIAECYRKLGEFDKARHHLHLGQGAVQALPDDDYGRMIRDSLDHLEDRLQQSHA